jgi:hypothetical protein
MEEYASRVAVAHRGMATVMLQHNLACDVYQTPRGSDAQGSREVTENSDVGVDDHNLTEESDGDLDHELAKGSDVDLDHELAKESDGGLVHELVSDSDLALWSVRESDGDNLVLANDGLAIGIYPEG